MSESTPCPTCQGQGEYELRNYGWHCEAFELRRCEDCGGTGVAQCECCAEAA